MAVHRDKEDPGERGEAGLSSVPPHWGAPRHLWLPWGARRSYTPAAEARLARLLHVSPTSRRAPQAPRAHAAAGRLRREGGGTGWGKGLDLPGLGSRFRARLAAEWGRADSQSYRRRAVWAGTEARLGRGKGGGKENACPAWGPSFLGPGPRPPPPLSPPQTKLGLARGGPRARLAAWSQSLRASGTLAPTPGALGVSGAGKGRPRSLARRGQPRRRHGRGGQAREPQVRRAGLPACRPRPAPAPAPPFPLAPPPNAKGSLGLGLLGKNAGTHAGLELPWASPTQVFIISVELVESRSPPSPNILKHKTTQLGNGFPVGWPLWRGFGGWKVSSPLTRRPVLCPPGTSDKRTLVSQPLSTESLGPVPGWLASARPPWARSPAALLGPPLCYWAPRLGCWVGGQDFS